MRTRAECLARPRECILPVVLGLSVLAACLVATATRYTSQRTAAEDRTRIAFEYRARDAERRIASRVKDYAAVLRGVSGFFEASDLVERHEFRDYVSALQLERTYPGLQAVGYQVLVPARDRPRHVAAVRAEGFPGYDVRPEGARDPLSAVLYVEPFTGSNPKAMGWDGLADPVRREAMERARDTGLPALTGRLTLVQDAGGAPQPGAILYFPVFGRGLPTGTVEERRAALLGWAYGAFRMPALLAGVLGERSPELDVEIYDGPSTAADALLFDSDASHGSTAPPHRFRDLRPVDVAGRHWTIEVRSTPAFASAAPAGEHRFVLAVGIALGLLAGALTWALASSRERVRTALRRSRSLHAMVMRNFPNGLVGLFDSGLRLVLVDGVDTVRHGDPATWTGRTVGEVVPPDVAPRLEEACQAALAGKPVHLELEVADRHVEVTVLPVQGEAGDPRLGMLLTQDVTEVRAMEARLVVNARLAAMGTLVGGIAHEINNPLAADLASQGTAAEEIRELRARLAADPTLDRAEIGRALAEVAEVLSDARQGARRIQQIVRDLTTLGHPATERSRVRLAEVVDRAMSWLAPSLAATSNLRVEKGPAPDVLAAPGQLEQVLVALVSNAARSAPPGERATVSVRTRTAEGGSACIEVSDDGEGIDAATLPRIFDPFFTTREVGQGMGLGLSLCHAIVTAHGGIISVASTPGHGSCFRVLLPAAGTRSVAA